MKVLMVCLGNICRSPMAEGILRKKATDRKLSLHIDSAGTGDWHSGENPDPRAIRTAKSYGVNISQLVARQFNVSDFDHFDTIFAMDQSNLKNILSLARNESDKKKVELLLDLLPHKKNKNVPDPWFGGEDGFTDVFNLLDEACEHLINKIS
ncbi:MAG: low molecular weight phosphotyrosine protein phosphatase [Bacteroidetes bacterium]|nr:MAG: low molecular weight phosphotyrosine protein phosphatase [Bacteroidota bacterium]